MVVPDSVHYLSYLFPDALRMPLYPWFLHLGDSVTLQIFLWVLTGYIIHKKTDLGILYFTTIGLIMLSQKILAETLLIFFITLAATSKKKEVAFIWICVAYFVKPVVIFFIPVMLISKIRWQYVVAGLAPIIVYSIILYIKHDIWMSTNLSEAMGNHCHSIGDYFRNIVINSVGKSVGLENRLLIRLSQVQILSYTIIGIIAAFGWRFNILYLFPVYVIIASGVAGDQGDRLHLIMVPVCLVFLSELFNWLEPPEDFHGEWYLKKQDT